MKKSLTLWSTNRGVREIKSGEIAPSLNLIELRYYPKYGFGVNEWSFSTGVLLGENPIKFLDVNDFVYKGNYFILNLKFKRITKASTIRITATHRGTGKSDVVWEGEIIPNSLELTCNLTGLSNTWDVNKQLKDKYPDVDFEHFTVPSINLVVPNSSMLIANPPAGTEVSTPILIEGFTKSQRFDVLVEGFVIGYGGNGGDAGMSTFTEDGLDVVYPTLPTHGGQICNRMHGLKIELGEHGFISCGEHGKSATHFQVNAPKQRTKQLGLPGTGGWPTGLNGKQNDVQLRFNHAREYSHAQPIMNDDLTIVFKEAVVDIKHAVVDLNKENCITPPDFDDSYKGELNILSAIILKDGVYIGIK